MSNQELMALGQAVADMQYVGLAAIARNPQGVRDLFERSWARHEAAYRRLAAPPEEAR